MINLSEVENLLKDIPKISKSEGWSSDSIWTKEIKRRFSELGQSKGYHVCASAIDEADFGEWLYDLVWVKGESKNDIYKIYECPLILESEWANHSDIMDDFHKLLIANAPVRVMIFQARNKEFKDMFLSDMKLSIEKFKPKQSGIKYIFVCYQSWLSEFAFDEFITP